MVIAIILVVVMFAAAGIFLGLALRKKKYVEFVRAHSTGMKTLEEIDSRYKFFPRVDYDQTNRYDNADFYETISCRDYLIYRLREYAEKIREQIGKIEDNARRYPEYSAEVAERVRYGEFDASTEHYRPNYLLSVEKATIKRLISVPETEFRLTVTLYCSTIDGRICDKKRQSFSAREILELIRRLEDKRGKFFNDRGIWDAICRVERGKVSNKMRFAVYERDGYRCRKCGASGKQAALEIDHIVPISKGGKSTFDNLQTLCHRCNVEKGNRLE